ncbi:rhodanese-like domain-containing protein [Virgibacillus sp. DJP39]|uniref:rhodanese-like domain-containing protein n=1 Tax=Virgibacillus sp. DJP39 TaxID=3409790 RepID=UPI003BB4B632
MGTVLQLTIIIGALFFVINFFLPVRGVLNITIDEAKSKFKDTSIQFVDVRTAHEFGANRKNPFINIPLTALRKRINELDKNKEVVVICQIGMRSVKASRILKKHGFEKIRIIKGGMSTWI